MVKIQKATLEDVKKIHDLIESYSKEGLMLYRHTIDLQHNIRNYFVCKEGKKLLGCCALRVWDGKSAEIYALAVDKKQVGKGIGTKLIKGCIEEGKKIEVPFIFTLTFRPSLFEKLKLKKIKEKSLPKIIFTEKTVNIDKAYGLKLR